MRSILLITTICLSSLAALAQTFNYTYTYDAAGNRQTRVAIQVTSLKGASIYDTIANSLVNGYSPESTYIDAFDTRSINIYPNPTRGELVIEVSPFVEGIIGSLKVIGIDGKLIFEQELVAYNWIDLTSAIAGEYILQVTIDRQIKTYTLIKQ